MSKARHRKGALKRLSSWLPLLLGPVAIAVTFWAYKSVLGNSPAEIDAWRNGWANGLEVAAVWILVAVVGIYWIKAIFTRNMTYVILLALAVCLLLRELHWDPAIKKVIFPLLGICLLWAVLWRDLLDKPSQNVWHTVFFFSALATYALAQCIEKKVLGKYIPILPDFQTLHTQYEEAVEVAGHCLLLLAAVLGRLRRHGSAKT